MYTTGTSVKVSVVQTTPKESSGCLTHLESRHPFTQTINMHLGRRSSKYERAVGLHTHPRTHAHTHTSPSVQVLLQRLHWRGFFSLTEQTAAGDSDWLPLISLRFQTLAPSWPFRDSYPPCFPSSHCCARQQRSACVCVRFWSQTLPVW